MKINDNLLSTEFMQLLEEILKSSPQGIGEFDLIEQLKANDYFDFLTSPALPENLFQAHFILFHALYLLQNKLLEEKKALLDIHTLKIELLAYKKGENALQQDDKLREYYLDFKNLENTSEEDVYQLLTSFWKQMQNFENRDDALAVLGLKAPVDDKTIKNEYRRLIMHHHPDRGGSTEKIQKLNDAIKSLLG